MYLHTYSVVDLWAWEPGGGKQCIVPQTCWPENELLKEDREVGSTVINTLNTLGWKIPQYINKGCIEKPSILKHLCKGWLCKWWNWSKENLTQRAMTRHESFFGLWPGFEFGIYEKEKKWLYYKKAIVTGSFSKLAMWFPYPNQAFTFQKCSCWISRCNQQQKKGKFKTSNLWAWWSLAW